MHRDSFPRKERGRTVPAWGAHQRACVRHDGICCEDLPERHAQRILNVFGSTLLFRQPRFNVREQAPSYPRKSGVVPNRLSDGTLALVASYPGYMWWFDQRVPGALELYDLDTIYGDDYHEKDKLGSVAEIKLVVVPLALDPNSASVLYEELRSPFEKSAQ